MDKYGAAKNNFKKSGGNAIVLALCGYEIAKR